MTENDKYIMFTPIENKEEKKEEKKLTDEE